MLKLVLTCSENHLTVLHNILKETSKMYQKKSLWDYEGFATWWKYDKRSEEYQKYFIARDCQTNCVEK